MHNIRKGDGIRKNERKKRSNSEYNNGGFLASNTSGHPSCTYKIWCNSSFVIGVGVACRTSYSVIVSYCRFGNIRVTFISRFFISETFTSS